MIGGPDAGGAADRGQARTNGAEVPALAKAAEEAGLAPSILNTQPWRWRVAGGVLELYADPSRQVVSIDPDGRLLTVSCGAALHHARVSLLAAGREPQVSRLPAARTPGLLASVRIAGEHHVRPDDERDHRSLRRRRSDRRPFAANVPVAEDVLAALRSAAEKEHARLHRIGKDQLEFMAAAARGAQTAEAKDERYQEDLAAWTTRSRATGEGVTPETIVAPVPRPVPVRDFAPDGEVLLDPGFGDDRFAEYLVVATDGDEAVDWLRAGEATSAVWLAATARGLAVSAMSEVVEVPGARVLLRRLLGGRGHPQLVLRVGVDVQPAPPPASPRRRAGKVRDANPPE